MPDRPQDQPEVREPKVSRPPPAGKKFPCGKCGAKLDFDPGAQVLKCPYCGHVENVADVSGPGPERDIDDYLNKSAGTRAVVVGRSSQVTCGACGAVVLLEDKVATDRCPYCGTHLENKPESAAPMISPESVLPFKVSERQAIEAFNGWIRTRWFAPSSLRLFANLGKLNGVYVPFWTYDAMTITRYNGERGDNYTVSETYTERNAQGHMETKTRQVTKTRWTMVSGEVRHFFDDVLICGSKGIPEAHVNGVGPWPLEELEGFRPEVLSGFQTERYGVSLKDGFEEAKGIMDGHIRTLCCQDIGGDQQRLSTVKTRHLGVTFKHILLPVWLAAYRYKDQPYQIVVNGRSGKVSGSRPYSWVKITLLVLLIVAAIGLLLWLLFSFGAGAAKSVGPSVGFLWGFRRGWKAKDRSLRVHSVADDGRNEHEKVVVDRDRVGRGDDGLQRSEHRRAGEGQDRSRSRQGRDPQAQGGRRRDQTGNGQTQGRAGTL
jgi:DNA-directed RNA polymerase subunit RPC12/RpoP